MKYLIFICLFLFVNKVNSQTAINKIDSNLIKKDTIAARTDFIPSILREGANIDSKEFVKIPPFSALLLLDSVNYPFVKVIYKEYVGFISFNLIEKNKNVIELENKYTKSYYNKSSLITKDDNSINKNSTSCPTVQCSSFTKKGARCKNMTSNCTRKCHIHN